MSALPKIITVRVEPAKRPGITGWFSGLGLLGQDEVPTVLRFSDEALQGAIDKLLADLPADKRAADIEIGADQQGVQVVVAVKLEHGWSLRGGVSYDYGASWGGKIGFRWVGK